MVDTSVASTAHGSRAAPGGCLGDGHAGHAGVGTHNKAALDPLPDPQSPETAVQPRTSPNSPIPFLFSLPATMKNALLVAAVAGLASALPQPDTARRLARRDGSRLHHLVPREPEDPPYRSNWAGAMQIGSGFTHVSAIFTVPSVEFSPYTSASAWVGIDNDSCGAGLLQVGISFDGNGNPTAWSGWTSDVSVEFDNFAVRAGDDIRLTVEATSTTAGVASVDNLSTGKQVSRAFENAAPPLCEGSAEWIIEYPLSVPLAHFGSLTFTSASATGSSGTVTPEGATIFNLNQDGKVKTDCATNGPDLTCKYVE